MTKTLTPQARARLEADAEGRDIVGLKPGQPFDPLGDMDRAVAQLEVVEAAKPRRPLRLVEADANSSPVKFTTLAEFRIGADGFLTVRFPPRQERAARELLSSTLGDRFTADDLRKQFSVSSFLSVIEAGEPDPSGEAEPD